MAATIIGTKMSFKRNRHPSPLGVSLGAGLFDMVLSYPIIRLIFKVVDYPPARP
jgi:hypothetical protein